MITRTSPHDYEKRVVIVSQLIRLCADCGGHTCPNHQDVRECMTCKSTETAEVWEHEATDFREALSLAKEMEKAQRIVFDCQPQMEAIRLELNWIANLNGDEEVTE